MSSFKKASRSQVKIRMSLASPTGFGKTVSALMIAYGITGDWSKIGLIDTENKSASLYANHRLPGGFLIGEFQTTQLEPPYTPEKYMAAIKDGEDEGFEVLIIDSVTHVWQGQGGLLEYNDSLGGNKFQNWAKTTPRYQKWLDSILQSKCHIITTNRKKQAYALVDEGGKKKVEKQGMEDQIRDGYDYEMTLAFELINDAHLAKASKDRTSLFMNVPEFIITPETGKTIKAWCDLGEAAIDPLSIAIAEIYAADSLGTVAGIWGKYKQFQKEAAFAAAKDQMKVKLSVKNEDLVGEMSAEKHEGPCRD